MSSLGIRASSYTVTSTPPTIVGSSTNQTSGTGNRTITPHASTATGDLLIVTANVSNLSVGLTAPAGWTAVFSPTTTGTMTTGCWIWKRAGGETTYTFTTGGSNVNSTHTCITVTGWSGTTANVVLGVPQNRATSGGTTTTTAPAITLAVGNNLVLCIGTERTTTTEVGISSIGNSFTEYLWVGHGAGGIETQEIAQRTFSGTGSTGTTSIVYPNSQANNALAWHLGIPPL
jgi:hypothetical protein